MSVMVPVAGSASEISATRGAGATRTTPAARACLRDTARATPHDSVEHPGLEEFNRRDFDAAFARFRDDATWDHSCPEPETFTHFKQGSRSGRLGKGG